MYHSVPHEKLQGLRSRQAPLLNVFINFGLGHDAMSPAAEHATVDALLQERSCSENRISFKTKTREVELITDPADSSSRLERKWCGRPVKAIPDATWSVPLYVEDEESRAPRKVRHASQGSDIQVSVRNDPASRERKSVFRRLSRPLSVFERLSSSPTGAEDELRAGSRSPLAGMIVGCTRNSVRKFMDLKIFGQPVARQNLVLRVVPGTKLFLFNYHTKELYGVYEATSYGRLRPNTLVVDSKDLLAQVRWTMWEKCPNLHISVFRKAMEDNFVCNKFKFDLNQAQVDSLVYLFMSSNMRLLKPTRRKVECLPAPSERLTKRARKFRDSEVGSVGGPHEELEDAGRSMESMSQHGFQVGGNQTALAPILDRNSKSVLKTDLRPTMQEAICQHGILPQGMPYKAEISTDGGTDFMQKERSSKSRSSSGASFSSAAMQLTHAGAGGKSENLATASGDQLIAAQRIGKMVPGKEAETDLAIEEDDEVSGGRDLVVSRLPRCNSALGLADVPRACGVSEICHPLRSAGFVSSQEENPSIAKTHALSQLPSWLLAAAPRSLEGGCEVREQYASAQGTCNSGACGIRKKKLQSVEPTGKGHPITRVKDAGCSTVDIRDVASVGAFGSVTSPDELDLNRPAAEDDEFLEVDKDILETEFSDGEDLSGEQQRAYSLLAHPTRTPEDLKPMKLLSNFSMS